MAYFEEKQINMFLGVVRKYMHMRGGLSQKDLAEMTDIGVSTMSRFLGQKTKELDPQVIAKIVAKLEIPLHEIIDFIEEASTNKFKKLVLFYKDVEEEELLPRDLTKEGEENLSDPFEEALSPSGTAKKTAKATVRIGKRSTTIPFTSENDAPNGTHTVKDKLARLSPRQKAYISDFLNLDSEGKDLVVDLGNSLFRYFRQKGVEF